jgi:hypothetical protein
MTTVVGEPANMGAFLQVLLMSLAVHVVKENLPSTFSKVGFTQG